MTEHRSARAWRDMQRAAMQRDFSWDRVAERYLDIYTRAIAHAAERVREPQVCPDAA